MRRIQRKMALEHELANKKLRAIYGTMCAAAAGITIH